MIVFKIMFLTHTFQIAALLGTLETHLLADLVMLLRDENTEVLKGVVTHLPQTLTAICGPLTSQAMHEAKVKLISLLNYCIRI